MTALGAIVDQGADELWTHIGIIIKATEKGSAITQDWGIRVLAAISRQNNLYEKRIFPFLKNFLQNCPAKDLPRHAESALVAVNTTNRGELRAVLEGRKPALKEAQAKRIAQVIKKIDAL